MADEVGECVRLAAHTAVTIVNCHGSNEHLLSVSSQQLIVWVERERHNINNRGNQVG